MKIKTGSLGKVFREAGELMTQAWLLIIAFFSVLLVVPLFSLRPSNPYNISNPYGPAFNPDNNFISVLLVIIATPLLFYSFQIIRKKDWGNGWLKVVAALVLLGIHFFTVIMPVHSGNFSPAEGGLNVFHAAEQAAPAQAFLAGKQPYSDIIFLRGGGIDVFFPALGFKIFGDSLGSYMLAFDIFRMIGFLSFAVLLGIIVRNFAVYGVVLAFFVGAASTTVFEFRDVFVWLAFGLVMYAFKTKSSRCRIIAFASIGLLAGITPMLVIDRGVLLLAVTALFALVLPCFAREGDRYVFAPKDYRKQFMNTVPLVAGLVVGFLLPLLFLGFQAYVAYIGLTFHDIPRYAGLLVSMPFPDAFGSQYQIWGSAYIAIALILLLSALYRFRTSLGMNRLLPLTFILIFSIVCLKMGTNRIDINKMATVTAPLFLAAVIASKYSFETIRVRQGAWKVIAPPMVLCLILLVSFSRIDMGRFLHQPRYTRGDLKSYLMTPAEDDESWLSPEMSEVARYIRDHTRPDDYIYAFTSNPIYYYLTKRQNPSRMYINWYNDPQPYTEETLRRLQETNPKIIIYSEKTWMDAPDNVPMEVRVPEINQWIMKKYIYRHTIGNTTLLSDGP